MSIHPGLLGKYELRERLGQGGMAEVWKAYDQRLQRFVAIKFLHSMLQADPAFLARFVREARAVASLRHPNIVQVYDFETATPGAAVGKDQPLAYMVMDYIEGQTLADYLAASVRARSFLSPQEIVSLFYSISSAVDYAHQRGLLHRDIKPSNILLDRRHTERNPMGEPVLTDFGIVKIQGSAAGTLTSSAMGTPLYIAPEQALGQPLDASSDVYALGVMLYEVCAGDLPFSGPTPVAIVQQHITESPPPPSRLNPAISPELEAVILRALAKKPAERFPSALALTAALAAALRIPLPAWQSQPISSPDLRALSPTDSTLLVGPASAVAVEAAAQDEAAISAPTLQSGLGAPSFSDDPTALSERPHLPTQRVDPLPAPALAQQMQGTTPAEVASGNAVKQLPLTPPISLAQAPASSPLTPLPPVERTPASRKRRGVLALISLVLLLLILGSGLAVFLRLRSQTGATATQAVGRAFFTSSGDGSGMDNQGLNDMFQVRLTGIPAPTAGNQYYAWLLPDQDQAEASARALGPLTISGGIAALHAPYVDPQHANLVALFSRFLVTEEPINPAPQSPSLDTAQWRYEGAIPQSASASDCPATAINQLSVLCHLRHLLSNDPELMRVNLRGGLNYWFLNNVKELQKWSTEAMDHQAADDVRHKTANMLYLLDGNACVTQDLLHGAPGESNVPDDNRITQFAAIPLLDCAQTPDNPGYLSHIHDHLNAMIQSPGFQKDQLALAQQIGSELNTINAWLAELRTDARQLLAMNDAQLVQPAAQAMRSQMDGLATSILSGGTDPATGTPTRGAASISDQLQQLASMDVMLFVAH